MRKSICRLIAVGVCVAVLPARGLADAVESLAGNWVAGPRVTEVAVESWQEGCAAAPKSDRSPGGAVKIEQRDDTLTIRAAARQIRSDECWGDNTKLRRIGTSYHDGLWVTRCATAPAEPREEQGTYTLRALGPDRLLSQDVTHIGWKLGQKLCKATVTTTQSMLRHVEGTVTTPSAPIAAPTAAPPPAAPEHVGKAPAGSKCRPGVPARISLRPREAEIALGKKICFQARVDDAAGCPIENSQLTWSLEQGPAVRGALLGNCFQAGESSAESEGHFEVLADLGALRARASVRVLAHSLRELTARRVEGAPSPTAEAHGGEGAEPAATRFAARAVGQTDRKQERLLMGIAALLALIAALLALYRRSRPSAGALTALPGTPTALQGPTLRCPSCGALYGEDIAFCGTDGTALLPVRRS